MINFEHQRIILATYYPEISICLVGKRDLSLLRLDYHRLGTGKGFPSNGAEAVQNRCVAITAMPLFFTFENLQPGSYAVAILHDANSDDKVNRNFIGIPLEGFGFSRNPIIRTGPPKFNDAVVLVAGPSTNIQIQLNYLLGG